VETGLLVASAFPAVDVLPAIPALECCTDFERVSPWA
jgi:hypothetical protein